MNLPFGLQLKSLLVGLVLAWFVIPWVQGLMAPKAPVATA